MGAQILGQDGASLLAVDSGSKAARNTPYDTAGNPAILSEAAQPTTAAGLVAMGMNDRSALPLRVDRLGSLAMAMHKPSFTDSFEGAASNNIRWLVTSTTMTAAQTTVGGLVFNSGNIVTASTGYMIQSARRFGKNQRQPMQAKFRARLNKVNNSVMELGFGDAATFNGANTSGAYWQVQANGQVVPVLTFNSVDVTGTDVSGLLSTANFYTFDIFMDDDECVFTIQDTSTGLILSKQSLKLPLAGIRLWSATALPLIARCYNTATPPATAPNLILTDVYLSILDANVNKPFSHIMAAQDRGCTANPFSGAQLTQWANSADPASATLSNVAAGYTTLGGRFQFAMVAGAATDYALFGFQVPAGANLHITGVDIDLWNTGAANAATPSRFEWALGVGSTAVSLATGTVTRFGLGAIGLAASAAVGVRGDRAIQKSFQTPLFCASGRFAHVILRCPVPNAATASQVIQGIASIEGYLSQ